MGTVDKTDQGYTVSGRWSLVSGCNHADWGFLTCFATQNGETLSDETGAPVVQVVAVPKSAFQIVDTWYSSGLRGSGSHDVVVSAAEVSAHHIFQIGPVDPRDGHDRVPIMAALTAIFAAQVLGVAQTAWDHLQQRGATEVTPGPMPDLQDRPEALVGIAAHWAALKAARLGLYAAADDLWQIAQTGEPVDEQTKTALYAASLHVMSVAKAAMADLHALGGSKALYVGSPLERRNRDMQAMLRHIVAQPSMQADVGRSLFGVSPQWPPYAI